MSLTEIVDCFSLDFIFKKNVSCQPGGVAMEVEWEWQWSSSHWSTWVNLGSAWLACRLRCGSGSIPGWGRSPGEGNGYSLQCSCLQNHMDRGAQWAPVHRVAKSQTWLSNYHQLFFNHLTTFLWRRWPNDFFLELLGVSRDHLWLTTHLFHRWWPINAYSVHYSHPKVKEFYIGRDIIGKQVGRRKFLFNLHYLIGSAFLSKLLSLEWILDGTCTWYLSV